MSDETISPLRRRMIEDMTVRGIGAKTRHDYVRHVRTFSAFIGRAPDTSGGPLGLTVPQVRRPESCPRLRIGVLSFQPRSLCSSRQRSETLGYAVQLPGTRKVSGGCPGRCLVGQRRQGCRAVHRRDPAIKVEVHPPAPPTRQLRAPVRACRAGAAAWPHLSVRPPWHPAACPRDRHAVLLGVQSRERLHDLVEGPGEREVRYVQGAEAVLGQQKDRAGRAGGKGGLADAVHALDRIHPT
jgi:hypothetical protein